MVFDNHIVANSMSDNLSQIIKNLGFSKLDIVGADPRVKMDYLWSKKSSTFEDADLIYDKCKFYISEDSNFTGYIEEESILNDRSISYREVDRGAWNDILLPFLTHPCPTGIYKACDIHLALQRYDPFVSEKLENSGFYYLELNKPSIGNVKIYTIQTQDFKTGGRVFSNLVKAIEKGGGVEGYMKFELTRNIYNQGFKLPPIILK